jgi:hypothetical protein
MAIRILYKSHLPGVLEKIMETLWDLADQVGLWQSCCSVCVVLFEVRWVVFCPGVRHSLPRSVPVRQSAYLQC